MSKEGVRYYARQGKLSVLTDKDGTRWFDKTECRQFAAARGVDQPITGTVCAGIMRAFEAGKTLPEIVVQFEVPPEQVRRLYREWRTPLGEDVPRLERLRKRQNRDELERHREEIASLDRHLQELAGLHAAE